MEKYWSERYALDNTPWDMGSVSPPLTAFLQQWSNKTSKILLPGAGNAYEAEWLLRNGFTNVWVIDIASVPLNNLRERCPEFPSEQLIHDNFFDLKDDFDLIIEQTFFCAINPSQRGKYANKMHELLRPKGKLVGVWFDFPLSEKGPPFGGSKEEYKTLFSPLFKINNMERCYNSIKPRAERELFLHLIRA